MSKKILHVINGEFFAGAERVQDLLAMRLPDFGYDCGFVCLKAGVFDKSRKSTSPVYVVPMRSKFDISIVGRISEIAVQGGYSAIHTHTPRSALIGRFVALKTGLPLFHHVHSPASRDTESIIRNALGATLEKLFVFPATKALIPVSNSLKGYLLGRGVKLDRISVVPNGVSIVRAAPAWKPPINKWRVGTVALFRPRKGLEVLLHSLRMLLDQGFDIELFAVGAFETSEYETQIKSLSTKLQLDGHVIWAGFTRDVHSAMENMHIFVLPSLYGEGLPMVVIEAMSVGIPVIATNVEGIPEVISNEKVGVVVEPNSASALFDGIKMIIQKKLEIPSIVLNAHRRQSEEFSDVAMAEKLSKIYNRVLQ